MKTCPRCKTTKPNEQWGISRKSSDGLKSYCKTCAAELRKEEQSALGKGGEYRIYKNRLINKVSGGANCCQRCGYSDVRALLVVEDRVLCCNCKKTQPMIKTESKLRACPS
jgi:hypothetical protein